MDKARIPLAEAEGLAAEVVGILSPFCARIEVLGSIRRKRAEVGDIEVGCIPKMSARSFGLFDDETVTVDLLTEFVKGDEGRALFGLRPNVNGATTCGTGTKFLAYKGFALDVFATTEPDAWGVLKLIRTGSGDFNKSVVLQWAQGGKVLPAGMRFEGGRLWDRGTPVPTPEEEDVFNAIGLAYIAPENRGAALAGRGGQG